MTMSQNEFIKLPRLYVDHDLTESAVFAPSEAQRHYLRNVLRATDGDKVRVFNGRNGEWLAAIRMAGKKDLQLCLSQRLKEQPQASRAVHLLFAPIKKARMDWLIEKSVELGVTHLHPVLTHNTEVRDINTSRIEMQIAEATEQCERLTVPVLTPLTELGKKLKTWPADTLIYAALEREDAPALQKALPQGKNDVAFLIGPEGGFSAGEKATLRETPPVRPISLGPAILRSETAAFVVLCAARNTQE